MTDTYTYPMPKLDLLPIRMHNKSGWAKLKTWLFSRRRFILREDYHLLLGHNLPTLFAPAGFIFDGASVPRPFTALVSPTSVLLIAALFHDIGYAFGGVAFARSSDTEYDAAFAHKTKGALDKMLRDVSAAVTGIKTPGRLAWFGVTVGGWIAWRRCRKQDRKMWEEFPCVQAPAGTFSETD